LGKIKPGARSVITARFCGFSTHILLIGTG
jgi:hypothetical protein